MSSEQPIRVDDQQPPTNNAPTPSIIPEVTNRLAEAHDDEKEAKLDLARKLANAHAIRRVLMDLTPAAALRSLVEIILDHNDFRTGYDTTQAIMDRAEWDWEVHIHEHPDAKEISLMYIGEVIDQLPGAGVEDDVEMGRTLENFFKALVRRDIAEAVERRAEARAEEIYHQEQERLRAQTPRSGSWSGRAPWFRPCGGGGR